jgi:hypothetical protein
MKGFIAELLESNEDIRNIMLNGSIDPIMKEFKSLGTENVDEIIGLIQEGKVSDELVQALIDNDVIEIAKEAGNSMEV